MLKVGNWVILSSLDLMLWVRYPHHVHIYSYSLNGFTDAWFEEDTPIYVHPKDPYKRVDVLPSTRHIVVKLNDTVLAETHTPTLLFETMLPTRYYMPKTALKWELLEESETVTKCPYKGGG